MRPARRWALAGLFELGPIVGYVLMALFSGFAAYGMLNLMRRVISRRLSASQRAA